MQTTVAEPTVWTDTDRRMMARALDLALKGVGQVSPGPLVGCVVISSTGEIAGEGFYVFEDIKHAETIALDIAGEKARGGTAYVSLEPHAHHGRTAPCTDALIAAGVKRVVASDVTRLARLDLIQHAADQLLGGQVRFDNWDDLERFGISYRAPNRVMVTDGKVDCSCSNEVLEHVPPDQLVDLLAGLRAVTTGDVKLVRPRRHPAAAGAPT